MLAAASQSARGRGASGFDRKRDGCEYGCPEKTGKGLWVGNGDGLESITRLPVYTRDACDNLELAWLRRSREANYEKIRNHRYTRIRITDNYGKLRRFRA